jgi:hypothetical protein
MNVKTCEYCLRDFLTKNLQRHYTTCKKKDEFLIEKKFEIQREQYEKELQILNQKNDSLQHQNELLQQQIKELQNQIFEIAKQPKNLYNNLTHNNQKTLNIINQLADYDLDTLDIEQQLAESFTEKVFHGGPRKIIEMATQLLFTDPETQKPKIICTDLSRKNFKYRNPDTGEIEVDPGFQKTHDRVRIPLAQANWNIYVDKLKQADCYRDTWKYNDSFIMDRTRFADKLLPTLSI